MWNSALSMAMVVQAVIVAGLLLVIYQIVKQQGRLLLRLDEVEARLAQGGLGEPFPAPPSGLAVGDPIAPFELRDLDGRRFSLEDFHGKRVLLVHWNPDCGFCEQIAGDLARSNADLEATGVRLVLAAGGTPDANRRLATDSGLKCPILMLKADSSLVQDAFQHQGTPVAYLLDGEGRVASPLAQGGEAILSLARDAMGGRVRKKRLPGERPLSSSRLVRDGLKAGTPAPLFRLPDLQGRMVALEDFRGGRVLLIFTDPHCGPCEELAPQLGRLQGQCREEGLSLIMVARGGVEENLPKAEANGYEFPVVIQERWKLSQQYGIFAVPVAFLIDEEGVIAATVARGVEQILALVPQAVAAEQP